MSNKILQTGMTQFLAYLKFVLSNFKAIYLVLSLAAIGVLLEYLAASVILPITSNLEGSSGKAVQLWHDSIRLFGITDPPTEFWVWLFCLLMAIRVVFGLLLTLSSSWLGKAIHRSLSRAIFTYLITDVPLGKLKENTIGHYVKLAGDDTFKSGNIATATVNGVTALSTAVVGLVIVASLSKIIFYMLILFLAVSSMMVLFLLRKIGQKTKLVMVQSAELNTDFIEAMNSIRSIRSFSSEVFVESKYREKLSRYTVSLIQIDLLKAATKSAPVILLLGVALIAFSGHWEVAGQSGIATIGATLAVILRIFGSLGLFVTAATHIATDLRSVGDIDELISVPTINSVKFPGPSNAGPSIDEIELRNVGFSYADNLTPVLDGISLTLRPGKSYGIVGDSGSGKSTLADIVAALQPADRGEVRTSGGVILNRKALLGGVVLVEQQPRIYSASIRENILLGLDVDDHKIFEVLDRVLLSEWLSTQSDGLATQLLYQGENLSGGQKQRLGIARALLREQPVIIFDEATSALDAKTTDILLSNILPSLGETISIFITHDARVMGRLDILYELKAGKLSMLHDKSHKLA